MRGQKTPRSHPLVGITLVQFDPTQVLAKQTRGHQELQENPSSAAVTRVLALQKQLDADTRFPAVLQPMQLHPEEQRAQPATPQLHRELGCSHGTSSRLLSQHHFPCRPRVLQERLHPALCSHHPSGPKPVQAPALTTSALCPLDRQGLHLPASTSKARGDLVLKKEDFSPFSSSGEPNEQVCYRSLPPPGGPALDVPSVAAGQGHAGSHVPALTAWGQGGSYTHSTVLTHTRHRCQSSNTINEP